MIDTINAEALAVSAAQFRALGDPARLRVLQLLQSGPLCVCKIQAALGEIAPNLLSYHLGILRSADLVLVQRRGRWLDYRLNESVLKALRDHVPQLENRPQEFGRVCGAQSS